MSRSTPLLQDELGAGGHARSRSSSVGSNADIRNRPLGLFAVVSIVFFNVSGGPLGSEEVISSCGPIIGLSTILVFACLYSVPQAMITAELSTAFPRNGGCTLHPAPTACITSLPAGGESVQQRSLGGVGCALRICPRSVLTPPAMLRGLRRFNLGPGGLWDLLGRAGVILLMAEWRGRLCIVSSASVRIGAATPLRPACRLAP